MGSISIWHWLVVLLIVALIFGTKRLRNMGDDVGGAVKNFRKAMQDDDKPTVVDPPKLEKPADPAVVAPTIDPVAAEQRERDPQRPSN